MKKLILGLLLLSGVAHASGKISITPAYFTEEGKVGGKFGISVYEKLMGPVSLNSWFGLGRDFDKGAPAHWAVSKIQFDVRTPINLVVGVGAEVDYGFELKTVQPSIFMSFSYSLWN